MYKINVIFWGNQMPTMLQEEVEVARETYVSRIILVNGLAFLVGDVYISLGK